MFAQNPSYQVTIEPRRMGNHAYHSAILYQGKHFCSLVEKRCVKA